METVENPTLPKERKLAAPQAWWQTQRAAQVGTVVLVLALLGTIAWWFLFRPFVTTDDARVAMTLVRISPSNVSGRIEKVNVEEGSRVKAGDVLVEIDHRIPQANFDRAQARAVLAERELGRLQKLTQQGSATPQALDQAKANDATAKVEMTLAQVALENTYLRSPFNGIVIQKLAEVGNLLEQNQTALVVADEDHAWIAANIEETAIGDVRVGQPVEITIDEGGKLHGKITEIRASVASQFALIPSDSGAGNYTKVVQRVPVRIALENSEHRPLRAGQSVEIKVRIH